MRSPTAFLTPATLLLGLAISENVSSLNLIISKWINASNTNIWRVSVICWFIVSIFLIFQIIILDFLSSPYVVPDWWIGFMHMMNYLLDYFATVAVGIILMIRMRVFYGTRSKAFITMIVLSFLLLLFKGIGIYYGITVSLSIMNLTYLNYTDHPSFPYIFSYLAIAHIIEAIFFTLGSLGFLFAIGKGLGKSADSLYMEILMKYDGVRLIMIIVLNVMISVFGLIAAVDNEINWVVHVGLYLPSITYALSFHTFLRNSYITAKEMVEDQYNDTFSQNKNSNLSNSLTKQDSAANGPSGNSVGYKTNPVSQYIKP
ncbi:hypothetical protein BC833DRAFT_601474 [Globomyces pollinis-pini]|nr:hypothetical protein BC833DRAFT_601474 [Globomyces pollinis-pini]